MKDSLWIKRPNGNITMFNSQIGRLALNRRKLPKWVQNGRQVLRIDPRTCRGHFLASGTGPAAQNRQNISQTPDQAPPAAEPQLDGLTADVFTTLVCPMLEVRPRRNK